MPRDRYLEVLSNLHVNDNDALPADNKDRLYKLRPIISQLNERFQFLKLPDEIQSIDKHGTFQGAFVTETIQPDEANKTRLQDLVPSRHVRLHL